VTAANNGSASSITFNGSSYATANGGFGGTLSGGGSSGGTLSGVAASPGANGFTDGSGVGTSGTAGTGAGGGGYGGNGGSRNAGGGGAGGINGGGAGGINGGGGGYGGNSNGGRGGTGGKGGDGTQWLAASGGNDVYYGGGGGGYGGTGNTGLRPGGLGGTGGGGSANGLGTTQTAGLQNRGGGSGSSNTGVSTSGAIGGGSGIVILNFTFLSYPCFKEDTKILTDQGYKLIQDLRKGDLVKTLLDDFKPIDLIGKRDIFHSASKERIKDQLYKCTHRQYPEVFADLFLTGCHSILVDDFISEEEKEKSIEVNGGYLCVTGNKYRLPACVDERTQVYEVEGTYTIYHLALENDDYYKNYGIYANGLLVESSSKRYLRELSGMELL
jgi:hypothetical protein